MSTSAERSEGTNPKTGMTHREMKEFIRNHFEGFVNRNNLRVGEVNFTAGFVDHGADVPPDCLRALRGSYSISWRRSKSSQPAGEHRRPDRRGRQGGAQPLDRRRSSIAAAAGIFREL